MLSLYYCHIQACFNVMFAEAETEREREKEKIIEKIQTKMHFLLFDLRENKRG